MIKNLLLIFISVFFICPVKANEDLVTIRVVLEKSVTSSRVANEFYKTINKIESSLPIMIGCRAMSELVLCKHVFNPISKLSHFCRAQYP